MAKVVFELNQSLDGYVDHQTFGPPDPALLRDFTERVRGLTGMLYGRGMYYVMRYWDEDSPDWDADEREYAAVWHRPAPPCARSLGRNVRDHLVVVGRFLAHDGQGAAAAVGTEHQPRCTS